MASDVPNRDPNHSDASVTSSPLRLLIRDEVMNVLRSERDQGGLGKAEVVKLFGRPGSRGYVLPRTERGQNGQGRAGATLGRVPFGLIAVMGLIAVVTLLGIQVKIDWEYTRIDVPYMGSIPKLRALFVALRFAQ